MLHWHHNTRFCERCGNPLNSSLSGDKRKCQSCGHEVFPRDRSSDTGLSPGLLLKSPQIRRCDANYSIDDKVRARSWAPLVGHHACHYQLVGWSAAHTNRGTLGLHVPSTKPNQLTMARMPILDALAHGSLRLTLPCSVGLNPCFALASQRTRFCERCGNPLNSSLSGDKRKCQRRDARSSLGLIQW